jgi:peptidoglycan L-alanyl-D-glutamate endopeptidase CwlK
MRPVRSAINGLCLVNEATFTKAGPFSFWPNIMIKLGDKGQDVKTWQEWLVSRKIDLDIDSDFGPATEKATKTWQRRAGVDADGKVGPATLRAAISFGFEGFDGKAEKITSKPVSPASPDAFKGGSELDRKNAAFIARLHPTLQVKAKAFLDAAKADGWHLQIVQGLRSFAEQDALFAQGRTKSGKRVTNARGGQSNHNYGTAFDAAPVVEGTISWNEKHFQLFGKWADIAGLSWGGRWKKFVDLPHLELKQLPKIATMLGWYRAGGLAEVWENVD